MTSQSHGPHDVDLGAVRPAFENTQDQHEIPAPQSTPESPSPMFRMFQQCLKHSPRPQLSQALEDVGPFSNN